MLSAMKFKPAALFVLSLTLLYSCDHESVDDSHAVAVAEEFYDFLKAGNVDRALSLFSPDFNETTDKWSHLLKSMHNQAGTIKLAKLEKTKLAAMAESPCFTLSYSTIRQAENSGNDEALFICRQPTAKSNWLIMGHSLKRHDNGRSIQAGILPTEIAIHTQ